MRGNRAETERTQAGWLFLRRQGVTARDIAVEAGLKLRAVQLGIQEARLREGSSPTLSTSLRMIRPPHLVLTMGSSCKALAQLACDDVHHGPIKAGSICCCAVCHQSGQDGHPALRRDPRTDPKPDKRPRHHERRRTRKESRALMSRLNPARST